MGAAGEELAAAAPNGKGDLVVPKVEEDPNAEEAVLAAEDVIVLLPNKVGPAPVDAGVRVAGSEGDNDGVLPKLNKLVSLFEAEVVA
jgi:hypothetical protein